MTTGEIIKKARKEAGLTQKGLGLKMGVSPQTIAQWENNLRKPKIETLEKIAFALGVDVAYLFDWDQVNQYVSEELHQNIMKYGIHYYGLMRYFTRLNEPGQQKAVERVEELTEIPKYQRTASPAASQPSGEGNYTPAQETPAERKETPPQADAQDGEEE